MSHDLTKEALSIAATGRCNFWLMGFCPPWHNHYVLDEFAATKAELYQHLTEHSDCYSYLYGQWTPGRSWVDPRMSGHLKSGRILRRLLHKLGIRTIWPTTTP